jgi:hypothetical protein
VSYASIAGRARTSSRNPQAHAICDRCGFRFNHVDLAFQYDWAGATVQNKRLLVCSPCMDNMQAQKRSIILPPDPPPIINPRPETYALLTTDYRITETAEGVSVVAGIPVPGNEDTRVTEADANRITGGEGG